MQQHDMSIAAIVWRYNLLGYVATEEKHTDRDANVYIKMTRKKGCEIIKMCCRSHGTQR